LRIVAISDTHRQHRKLEIPDGDVLVHCGDITMNGELSTIEDFSDWLSGLPHKNKLIISGNHDWCFQREHQKKQAVDLINKSATYLQDSSVVIDGIKFYGSPWQPRFHNWAFNLSRGEDIAKVWRTIPDDVNVVLTHGPVYGILDEAPRYSFAVEGYENVGCQDLFERVLELPNLKLHCAGHIHSAYGHKIEHGINFVNASSCNEQYQAVNKPIVIDI
jgi:Icc-related predicted phosphoesterase